jgi:hypothetical protein
MNFIKSENQLVRSSEISITFAQLLMFISKSFLHNGK